MHSCPFGVYIIIFLDFILEPSWKVSRQTFGFLLAHKLGNGCSIMVFRWLRQSHMLKVYFASSPQSIPTVSPLSCLPVDSNITVIVIFQNFICGLLKCIIQKFTLKYISDKTAKHRCYVLCLPTYLTIIMVSQWTLMLPRIPNSQTCLKCRKASSILWRNIIFLTICSVTLIIPY